MKGFLLSILPTFWTWRISYAEATRAGIRPDPVLKGKVVVNLFFENSTRTMSSFEIAARRLGADVISMPVAASSVKKGETLIDTAMTLNAMKPDALIVRHSASGGPKLLSRKVDCAVINAGDGTHQHPTQGLLDTLTIRRTKGRIEGPESGHLWRHCPLPCGPVDNASPSPDGRGSPPLRPTTLLPLRHRNLGRRQRDDRLSTRP